jgi:PAS domain S-box-containing protein
MKEVVKINLGNEMDLILANRRTMKLAELCGLTLTSQTAVATAVSEIARCAISKDNDSYLKLGITSLSANKKQITAVVCNTNGAAGVLEAVSFAKRLITEVKIVKSNSSSDVELNQDLKFSGLISDLKIESFIQYFLNEPPLSPYDEIRRQNIQLLEFSDKLRESENQHRQLTETLPLMMFSMNHAGETVYVNKWLHNYFGASLNFVSSFKWLEFVHPDDKLAINNEWNNIFKSGKPLHAQARLKQAQKTYLWHLISIVPVRNENEIVTHWIGFFADIHAQKNIEEALKDNVELKETTKKLVEYQDRLQDKISELNITNHELEQFAYIASHDLQEPLRKIVTYCNLLEHQATNLDENSKYNTGKIISSAKRMSELIAGVLDWSMITKTKTAFSEIDLNGIVDNIKMDYELVIQQKQAVIETSSLDTIQGIPGQIAQLFTNLISNALKFCTVLPVIKIVSKKLNAQEIQSNRKLDASIAYTEITLSDNGIGFEQEYAEQIFEIFQRLNSRSEYKGTGIGLAICKKIVENHRGFISATSQLNMGSTFKIIIPTR